MTATQATIKEWLLKAANWQYEAEDRERKAKTDARKHYATHMKAAREAQQEARRLRQAAATAKEVLKQNVELSMGGE